MRHFVLTINGLKGVCSMRVGWLMADPSGCVAWHFQFLCLHRLLKLSLRSAL